MILWLVVFLFFAKWAAVTSITNGKFPHYSCPTDTLVPLATILINLG